tara:strand:+ start:1973 stop:3781 length:1809 start_codon:yes stop_codon:yes gene_type:complete
MKVLAVTLEKCSGCALLVDDKIVFSTSEERYSRIKSDSSFPINSIKSALRFANIKGKDLDKLIICGNQISVIAPLTNYYSKLNVKEYLDLMKNFWYPRLIQKKNLSFLKHIKDKINKKQYPFNTNLIKGLNYFTLEHPKTAETSVKVSKLYKKVFQNLLSIEPKNIIHLDHHSCHAAYALYGSPIRKHNTLVVTADAWGDGLSGTVSLFNKNKNEIRRVKKYFHGDFQLGRIYKFTTLYLRMLQNEHEYKVMGLSSYYSGPKREEVEEIFDKMLKLKGINFKFNPNVKDIFVYLEKELNHFRFDHIAAGLQKFTEKLLKNWFESLVKHYKCDTVVFSGGTSMNVKANMIISEIKNIKNFFVCGAGTDETLPIGACYYWSEFKKQKTQPLKTLYLGDDAKYDFKLIKQNRNNKHRIIKFNSEKQIVDLLLQNKIISVCRGRMEMGQRALGNRSIIADPRISLNIEKINRSIKQRDFWMPFAPIILYEFQDELINNPKKIDSPYMTITYRTKNGKLKIPAAVHMADETTRAQILKKEHNPALWKVIYKFYKKTGIPAVLNTSFNLHGYPIVRSVKDGINVFNKSDLDVLWLEKHLLIKNKKKVF